MSVFITQRHQTIVDQPWPAARDVRLSRGLATVNAFPRFGDRLDIDVPITEPTPDPDLVPGVENANLRAVKA